MELLLAGGLLGAGLYLNNNGERIDPPKANVKNMKPSNKNIYESNYSKEIEKELIKKQHNRYKKAIQNESSIIPLDSKLYKKSQDIDNYETQPSTYLDRPVHTRKMNERDGENVENFTNFKSLSGEMITQDDFTHNNMVPFFGSQVRQNVDIYANQGLLENFTGNRVNDITKEEIAPLFEPTKNMSNVYGTNVIDDNVKDRYVASKYTPFTHPIEQIKVGPGLNQGYSSKPTGGFQDPTIREFAMPKTTDELRVATNPKLSYKGTVIPGKKISKPGMIGKLEKRLPDTYYLNNPDRYNTTVGAYTKPKMKPKTEFKKTNRLETMKSYTGGSGPATRVKPNNRGIYQQSKNAVLSSYGYRNANKTGEWDGKNNDYGKSGIEITSTERDVTQFRTHTTNVVSAIKALIAPIQDILKPSKKENSIGNIRQAGNVTMPIPAKQTVYDPNDITRTTIKETQIHNERTGNVRGATCLTVYDPNDVMKYTIKDTNIHNTRSGNMSHGLSQLPAYDPNDITRTTIKETNIHNNRQGNMNHGVSQLPAYDPNDITKTTIKETNIHNNRQGNMNHGLSQLPAYDPNDITKTTIKETNIHNNRQGNMNHGLSQLPAYDPNDITRTTLKETNIHNNRQGNMNHGLSQLPAYDPNDITRTTLKETNIHNNRQGNMNHGLSQLPAYDPNDITKTTIKETNIHNNRQGNMNHGLSQLPAYDPNDITRTTVKETNIHNNRQGNMNHGLSQLPAYDPNDITRTTIKETNIHNNRRGNFNNGVSQLPAYDPNDTTRTTIKETNIHNNRQGNFNNGVSQLPAYDPNDTTRTTVKETNIHNNRQGNFNNGVSQLPAYDPNDITRTTIKETNIHNNRSGNIESSKKEGLICRDPEDISKITLRNTLQETDYNVNLKQQGPAKNVVYNPNEVARTTIKETNIHNERDGNIGGLEHNDGYKIESAVMEAPNTNRQFTTDEYIGDPSQPQGNGYLVNDYRAPNTNKQFTSDNDYTGIADSSNNKPISYQDVYNATLNDVKQDIAKGRIPTQNSVKIPLGEDSINMTTNKIEHLNDGNFEPTRIVQMPPDMSNFNSMTTEKTNIENEKIGDRLNPEMLEAFKNNPLTQPLDSHT